MGEGEQIVIGETPNLAARLQGIAEMNAVVIAESTRQLLGGRLSCAPVHVAGRGNPRLDSGHITRSGLMRHLWNKQQGRQNQELLHGSHSPMTRSIIMIFWVVVKFRKEGPLAQR